MELPQNLTQNGFTLADVEKTDFGVYFAIKRECYEKYVDEYFGRWVDDVAVEKNTDAFSRELEQSEFKKIFLHGELVGFFSYDERDGEIGGVTIQMLEKARGKGVGSFCMKHITEIADSKNVPIFLKVFKSNPAKNLYERFGFKVYDESEAHYQMRYN